VVLHWDLTAQVNFPCTISDHLIILCFGTVSEVIGYGRTLKCCNIKDVNGVVVVHFKNDPISFVE
jgi:hypothetical protein